MPCCGSTPKGVSVEVLKVLLDQANTEDFVADAAQSNRRRSFLAKGTRKKDKPEEEAQVVHPRKPETVRVQYVHTKVVKSKTNKSRKSYVDTVLKNPGKAGVAKGLVQNASVLLVMSMQAEFSACLQAIADVRIPDCYYYVDFLALNFWGPKVETLQSSSVMEQRASIRDGVLDTTTMAHEERKKVLRARPAVARAVRERMGYWGDQFVDAARMCKEAVFVLEGLDKSTHPPTLYDLQWLYSLSVARSLGLKITIKLPPDEQDDFEAGMLNELRRRALVTSLKSVTIANAECHLRSEEAAIRGAIGLTKEAVRKTEGNIFRALAEFVQEEGWRIVERTKTKLSTLDDDQRQEVFGLYVTLIALEIDLIQVQMHENPKAKGPELYKHAWERTNELVQLATQHYGENHSVTLDARLTLANMHRRRGADQDVETALDIYTDLAKKHAHEASKIFASSSSSEKHAGAETMIAMTLRDLGRHDEAYYHFQSALQLSSHNLGKDDVNTYVCHQALANCLRARYDDLVEANSKKKGKAGGVPSAALPLLREAEEHYRAAVQGLVPSLKPTHQLAIAARLNHAVVLLELVPEKQEYYFEATTLLMDLEHDCGLKYGTEHEVSAYVSAKLGELKHTYDNRPKERAAGKARMTSALDTFKRLGLKETEPRVQEVKRGLAKKSTIRVQTEADLLKKAVGAAAAAPAASASAAPAPPAAPLGQAAPATEGAPPVA